MDWVRLLSVTWASIWRIYLRIRNQPEELPDFDSLPDDTNYLLLGYAAPMNVNDYIEMYLEIRDNDESDQEDMEF